MKKERILYLVTCQKIPELNWLTLHRNKLEIQIVVRLPLPFGPDYHLAKILQAEVHSRENETSFGHLLQKQ